MQLSKAMRITLTVCGTVLAVAVIGAAVYSGSDIDTTALIGSIVGAVAAGLGIAGGPSRGAGAVVLLAALGLSACGAPCVAERAVVSALDVGVEAAGQSVGDQGGEDWDTTLDISRGAVMLGHAAVDACELAQDSTGWQAWVGLALETAVGLSSFFGSAGDDSIPAHAPDELDAAILTLRGELPTPTVTPGTTDAGL